MSRLDEQIDRVVREMLDVEPPMGLRAQVRARLDAGARPSQRVWWAWAGAAAAVAALLAVALVLPSSRQPVPSVTTRLASRIVTLALPAPAGAVPPALPRRVAATERPSATSVALPQRVAVATVAAPAELEGSPQPLADVKSIEVHAIATPGPTIAELQLPRMSIPELSIGSITDQPRERREE